MAGQVWSVAADGGYMYSDQLSDYIRMSVLPTVRFRQFCDAEDHSTKGYHKGENFTWNIYSKVATAGGAIAENAAMPETKFTITQGTGTVTEYGNSVPYTGKLDDLSQHNVEAVIDKVLKIDATEAFDDAAYTQFNATPLRVAPTGGTSATAVTLSTSGATTITNNKAMAKAHVGAIVDEMKERNIPAYFDSGDYGVIARPKTFRTVKTELEGVHQYVDAGFDMIMNGEIGRYEGVRFFEQTQVAGEGWTNYATTLTDGAFFFGGDTVHEAVVCSEEMRGKIPADYGRDKGIAWFYEGGFKLVHSAAADARIVKWDSAG